MQQAGARDANLDDVLIVDVDSHHTRTIAYDEFCPISRNDVLRQLGLSGRAKGARHWRRRR